MEDNPIHFPDFGKDNMLRITQPVHENIKKKIDGIYKVIDGKDLFGEKVVVKWNGSVLSIFTGVNYAYFVLDGGHTDSAFIFEGYWRNNFNLTTGLARLTIKSNEGGWALLSSDSAVSNIFISGTYGHDYDYPMIGLSMKLVNNIEQTVPDFMILAHRGGGRTSDLLPASENSLGILQLASKFGSDGVEIDVRQTSDGVLILYHDEYFTNRLINGEYMLGKVESYSYKQIRTFCTLKDGSLVPTLIEALDVILNKTDISTVWLDTKAYNIIDKLINIQELYKIMAVAAKRDLKILIGIPDEKIYDEFINHPRHEAADALCEIGLDKALSCKAEVWAPRWTLGMMTDEIKLAHKNNIKVFLWTVDDSEFMHNFIYEGLLDGILTNYPSRVAWEYYIWKNE